MALLDLLGRRWTLRVLWELRDEGLGFRELQARCDAMLASVLSRRLGELRDAGIVQTGGAGVNSLTPDGRALLQALGPLDRWARRWSPE
jgi:DNA-binding HxlR family transcriptional regulator